MTVQQLITEIGVRGADAYVRGMNNAQQAFKQLGDASISGAGRISSASVPLLNMAANARSLAASIASLGAGVGVGAGVGLAAQYQRLELGFTTLLGSARTARALLADLKVMGETTPFQTFKLAEFARLLVATGSSAAGVTRQMRLLADVGAAGGMDVSGVGEMAQIMARMRLMPHAGLEQFEALGSRGVNLQKVAGAVTGREFSTPQMAAQYFSSFSGQRAFEKIFQGIEKVYGGSASRLGSSSLLGIVQNLGESLHNIMLPTGRMLLPMLGALANSLMFVSAWLGRINELTGGSAGLGFMLMGLFRAKSLLIGSAISAARAVNALTASIGALSVASAGAAAVGTGAAAAGAAAAGARGLFKAGLGALRGMGALGVGLAIDVGGNWLGDRIGGGWGGFTKDSAMFGGIGFMVGRLHGLAAGVGIAILKNLYQAYNKQGAWGPQDKLSEIAENTKKSSDYLQDLRSQIIGGGERAKRTADSIEAQISIQRMAALGAG